MDKLINFERKKPLYRKVNTTAHAVRHQHGGDYRDSKHKDTAIGMRQGVRRGLDYTPLFRFLLSKVGSCWQEVHREAVARLDRHDPIFWLVALHLESAQEVVRLGENAYFSCLYVDHLGILSIVNPLLNEGSMVPSCQCCTHTFNGLPFSQSFKAL